jgi:predicted nucleotidyltransferase/uncharacterized protein with HEPN domain
MSEHDDTIPLERMAEGIRASLEVLSGEAAGPQGSPHLADWALTHAVQSVGFAAARVSPPLREHHREVPWTALIEQSDALLSRYDEVDVGAVRRRVAAEFPRLLRQIEGVLQDEAARPRPSRPASVTDEEVAQRLGVTREALERFCRKHGISRLSVFGSVVREDFGSESDIDAVVEFESGRTPGLQFFSIQDELAQLLGRPVDLLTSRSMRRSLRDRVGSQTRDIYVAGG